MICSPVAARFNWFAFSKISEAGLQRRLIPSDHGKMTTCTDFRWRLLLATFLKVFVFFVSPQVHAQTTPTLEARVSKIMDGDTFTLSGEPRRIRVWGLDAPEWDNQGGSAATAALRQMIQGQWLRCEVLDVDRYGRFVAQCFLPDGGDIAAEMIRSGAAAEYCRYSRGFYGTC